MDSDHVILSSDEELELKASGHQVISVATNKMNPSQYVQLKKSDFLRLEYGKWLNDNLLDYGMYSLSQHISSNDASRIQLFSTFFYTKLVSEPKHSNSNMKMSDAARKHANVCKWTKNINIFDKMVHIYPINEIEHHWYVIIVVFPSDKEPYIAVLDSDAHDDKKYDVIYNLKNYLVEELQIKSIKTINKTTIKEMKTMCPKVPKQSDGSSCGLFVLYYVKEIFKRVDMLNSLFDDMSSWHRDKKELVTMRYELAKTIKITGVRQGYGDVKLPDLQYLPTAAEDKAFKKSKKDEKVDEQKADINELETATGLDIPYHEYLRKIDENQQDFSLIWSCELTSSEEETS